MLLQESFIEEPDGLVSVNLLVVSAVSAFATGAVLSGLTVCWIMSHRHRHSRSSGANGARRKSDKEQSMLGQGRSGSVMSVTRTSGGERRRSQADNPFVTPNGWPKGEMDPGLLPTPEQTPLQQKRGMHLPDTDWDQSQTFLTAVGTPCPNNSVIYLSSKYLHGGGGGGGMVRIEDPGEVVLPLHAERQRYLILATQRGEHGGSRPSGTLRNSAGEYIYPATPQDSPDRRRVVSAPTPHMDYGEPRWSHEVLNYNSNNGALYHAQRQGLIRPDMHGPRGLGELADFSHLLVKNMGERAPSGQWGEVSEPWHQTLSERSFPPTVNWKKSTPQTHCPRSNLSLSVLSHCHSMFNDVIQPTEERDGENRSRESWKEENALPHVSVPLLLIWGAPLYSVCGTAQRVWLWHHRTNSAAQRGVSKEGESSKKDCFGDLNKKTISLVAPNVKDLPPPFCSLFWRHGSSLGVKFLFLPFSFFLCQWASSRKQCALLWISNETDTVVAVPEGSDSQWILQCVRLCVYLTVWMCAVTTTPTSVLSKLWRITIYWSFCKQSQRDKCILLCVSGCVNQSEGWVAEGLSNFFVIPSTSWAALDRAMMNWKRAIMSKKHIRMKIKPI